MKQKTSIIITLLLVAIATLIGCTSESQPEPESDLQALTFTLRTNYNEYENDDLSIPLLEEIIDSFNPNDWDFLVLEPDETIQDSTFIQVGAPDEYFDFQYTLNIGFGDAETGYRMYGFYTEDKSYVKQFVIDYWQEHQIPDISSWEDVSPP